MPLSKVEQAIEKTLDLEKGYVNNPNDKGGETNWGITVATARAHGYFADMAKMPRQVAKDILLTSYWSAPGFGRVAAIDDAIAWELFDAGVLSSPGVPSRFLQRALNVLNNSHKDKPLFPDLKVDGQIGTVTLNALASFLKYRGAAGGEVMLKMLNAQQGVFFIEITENRVKNEEFIFGWFSNRVAI